MRNGAPRTEIAEAAGQGRTLLPFLRRVKTLRLIPMSRSLSVCLSSVHARAGHCALMLAVLVFPGNVGAGESSPQSFWELRPDAMDAMLQMSSDDNSRRYVRLRQYFADLHCTSASIEEQNLPKHGEKNLICVLPGKDTEQIVVAARYDRRSGTPDPAQGWSEAVMLPVLYNALLAGQRQHTFVFVALCGTAGENVFLASLRSKHLPPAKAMVVMDTLGLSGPWYYALEGTPLSAKARERAIVGKQLESDAAFTARLQGLPVSLTATPSATENSLLFHADSILPSILVYSVTKNGLAVSGAFRQDFEFLAYYLCRLDVRLADPPAATHP